MGDLAFDQEDLGDVAGVSRDHGVDPRPRQVGGGEARERDALAGVGGPQHVAPGPGPRQLHRQQEAQRQRERRSSECR